ncbi:hypothetical protein [Blattabacterium sp. (Blatta orientalis)]|nr:hypothetical protein [Blattabacterium sp. (Blatta orientalis)]
MQKIRKTKIGTNYNVIGYQCVQGNIGEYENKKYFIDKSSK